MTNLNEHPAALYGDTPLEEARTQLTILRRVSQALAGATSVKEALDVLTANGKVSRASKGCVYFVEAQALHLQSSFGYATTEVAPWAIVPLSLPTPAADVVKSGRALLLRSNEELRLRYASSSRPSQDQAEWQYLTIPIPGPARLIGVLTLQYPCDIALTESAVTFQTDLGIQFGQAIERGRLFESVQTNSLFEQRLLGVLGHDLRSPLSAISMLTEVLAREPHERVATVSRAIQDSASRMSEILDDILRLALNREQPVPEWPNDLVISVRQRIEELCTNHPGRVVQLNSPDQLEARIDAGLLGQIVVNLGRNALLHGSNEGTVLVELCEVGSEIELAVHNTGSPIPQEISDQLFKAFQQGDDDNHGVGLGLYIVSTLAKRLGGTVTYQSDASTTVFRVRLPRPEP